MSKLIYLILLACGLSASLCEKIVVMQDSVEVGRANVEHLQPKGASSRLLRSLKGVIPDPSQYQQPLADMIAHYKAQRDSQEILQMRLKKDPDSEALEFIAEDGSCGVFGLAPEVILNFGNDKKSVIPIGRNDRSDDAQILRHECYNKDITVSERPLPALIELIGSRFRLSRDLVIDIIPRKLGDPEFWHGTKYLNATNRVILEDYRTALAKLNNEMRDPDLVEMQENIKLLESREPYLSKTDRNHLKDLRRKSRKQRLRCILDYIRDNVAQDLVDLSQTDWEILISECNSTLYNMRTSSTSLCINEIQGVMQCRLDYGPCTIGISDLLNSRAIDMDTKLRRLNDILSYGQDCVLGLDDFIPKMIEELTKYRKQLGGKDFPYPDIVEALLKDPNSVIMQYKDNLGYLMKTIRNEVVNTMIEIWQANPLPSDRDSWDNNHKAIDAQLEILKLFCFACGIYNQAWAKLPARLVYAHDLVPSGLDCEPQFTTSTGEFLRAHRIIHSLNPTT